MILRPSTAAASEGRGPRPVWPLIEETQKSCGSPCWIITQPDHAALAGDIAANLGPPLFDALDAEVIQGIALHDEGWAPFDSPMPQPSKEPVSFFEVDAQTVVAAWCGSIECAERAGPMAGAIVSRHFWRIGKARLSQDKDGPLEIEMMQRFLAAEELRERRLVNGKWDQMESLTDVLQFCDVLSLYLCCGATGDVSFPQHFRGISPVLRRVNDRAGAESTVCRFEPSPFGRSTDLAIPARRFPDGQAQQFAALLY